MSEHDLDGAVTSRSAKGIRLQATGFSQKESEKEAAASLLWLWPKPVA